MGVFGVPPEVRCVVGSLTRGNFSTCVMKNYIHSVLLKLAPRSCSVAAGTAPGRVVSIFPRAMPANVGRNAMAILIRGRPIRIAAFHYSKSCLSSHRPRDMGFMEGLERSLSQHSFAIGTVTCGGASKLYSLFNKRGSVRGGALHTINGPRGQFGRSTLHVLELFEFTSALGFGVRGGAFGTTVGCTSLVGGMDIRHVVGRLGTTILNRGFGIVDPLVRYNNLSRLKLLAYPSFRGVLGRGGGPGLYLCLLFGNGVASGLGLSGGRGSCVGTVGELGTLPLPRDGTSVGRYLEIAGRGVVHSCLDFYNVSVSPLGRVVRGHRPCLVNRLGVAKGSLVGLNCGNRRVNSVLRGVRTTVVGRPAVGAGTQLLDFLGGGRWGQYTTNAVCL